MATDNYFLLLSDAQYEGRLLSVLCSLLGVYGFLLVFNFELVTSNVNLMH